ncbi:glycoside hydrolase family 5 protein [Chloroflexia bacterium SDU3-3]|nr:glycoside hydrolase family 5 protein [Chloroflexia bacterium SDU3-3]
MTTRYGFNFLWMFSSGGARRPQAVDEQALDFMADFGFNFVRIPTDYRFWVKDFDYFHPDETVFEQIDSYLAACRDRKFQMSLNIHRGPGYCINGNELERHNLWVDQVAQDAFVFMWETFACRYKGVPNDFLNFDLLNEPPNEGQYGMTRENHAAIMRRVVAAIRAIDPDREIVIDGVGGGHLAMPELADLGVIHSGRGYQPMPVSHHKAQWWDGAATAPAPVYPGVVWHGVAWDRDVLREFYQPWRDVAAQGVKVHIGECGCYNKTPNDVALRWLGDLFGLYKELGWGFALWNFAGDFGIVDHGRPGARYEQLRGLKVDRELLDILLASRVAA